MKKTILFILAACLCAGTYAQKNSPSFYLDSLESDCILKPLTSYPSSTITDRAFFLPRHDYSVQVFNDTLHVVRVGTIKYINIEGEIFEIVRKVELKEATPLTKVISGWGLSLTPDGTIRSFKPVIPCKHEHTNVLTSAPPQLQCSDCHKILER